jgi:hypothetical protein
MNKHVLKQFHSCYIVDIEIDETDNLVRLLDSSRMKYIYKFDNPEKKTHFEQWLNKIFFAGKSQTLSVFSYHEEGCDHEIEVVIDNFIGDFLKDKMLCEKI